jgi:hypothetical protein
MEVLAFVIVVAAVVWLQGFIYRKYAFRRLEYRCYLSAEEVFEGDEIELVEEVINRKALPLTWLKSELTTSKWLDFAGSQSTVADETRFVPSFFMVRGYHSVVRRWRVTCTKFGVHRIEKAVLVSTDLLGLTSFSKPMAIESAITVLPRPVDLCELTVSSRRLMGEVAVRRRFLPDPFVICGVREYTQFDPMNRIHWSATAREKRLMVFQNQDTASQRIAVILNMQSRPQEGRFVIDVQGMENCIRICAACFDATLQTGIPVRFLCNGLEQGDEGATVSNEFWGQEHVRSLLRTLSRLAFQNTEKFSEFLQGPCSMLQATDIVLVSCYFNEEMARFALQERFRGVNVRAFTPLPPPEEGFPAGLNALSLAACFDELRCQNEETAAS